MRSSRIEIKQKQCVEQIKTAVDEYVESMDGDEIGRRRALKLKCFVDDYRAKKSLPLLTKGDRNYEFALYLYTANS